jgi:sigma-B regulation protein RsbU (phosphoserine phosphatase)
MDPAKAVGGDFYDFFMVDDDHLACVIADVSGKGVPAALFMMISKTVVQNYAKMGINAGEVLTRANAALCAENKMEMFVTVWIGILEVSTGRMVCSSAGHEYPAIYHDGAFELFKDRHGLVLGGMDIARYRDYEIQLGKGDKVFVYTDGVPEATNESNELFGTDRMIEALNSDPGAGPRQLLKNVRASVDAFVGTAEQFDDLTMLCVEYKGAQ